MKLLDDDGENGAVRLFLACYRCGGSKTIGAMKAHFEMSGFDGCWPDWCNTEHPSAHITKGGAQLWIRHLFTLEAQQVAVPNADMFWNPDDAEKLYSSISEFLNDEICNGTELAVGDIRTVQRAVRLPNIDIRITSVDEDECGANYEIVEVQGSKSAAQQVAVPAKGGAEDKWRKLALQFDGQRMQALGHLRAMTLNPHTHMAEAMKFLATPPAKAQQVAVPQPVARVDSWTNGSYSRNYKITWLENVPEGALLYSAARGAKP